MSSTCIVAGTGDSLLNSGELQCRALVTTLANSFADQWRFFRAGRIASAPHASVARSTQPVRALTMVIAKSPGAMIFPLQAHHPVLRMKDAPSTGQPRFARRSNHPTRNCRFDSAVGKDRMARSPGETTAKQPGNTAAALSAQERRRARWAVALVEIAAPDSMTLLCKSRAS